VKSWRDRAPLGLRRPDDGRGAWLGGVLGTIGCLALGCADAQKAAEKVRDAAVGVKEEATRERLACDADVPRPLVDGCLSGTLTCGSSVTGTTEGGESALADTFYAGSFCFPAGDDRSGPERVYLFEAPANQDVRIRLDSDCVDLDVAAVAWNYDGSCPTENHLVPECESSGSRGGGSVRLNVFHARDYLLVVDGKQRATGTFRLTVDCSPLVR
jgi:hypothetical protein